MNVSRFINLAAIFSLDLKSQYMLESEGDVHKALQQMEKTQNPGPTPPTGPARPDLLTQSRIQVVLKMGGKTRENEA